MVVDKYNFLLTNIIHSLIAILTVQFSAKQLYTTQRAIIIIKKKQSQYNCEKLYISHCLSKMHHDMGVNFFKSTNIFLADDLLIRG